MLNLFPSLEYPKLKLSILVLLTLNALIYALVDTLTGAVDAIVWLVLLVLYEAETNLNNLPLSATVLQNIRHALIVVIVLVFFSYMLTGEWLDVLNTLLWLVLIALLELEVRYREWVTEHQSWVWLIKIATFCALVAIAVVWCWMGDWLDGYDAFLWITAFALIEVDIFYFLQRQGLNPKI